MANIVWCKEGSSYCHKAMLLLKQQGVAFEQRCTTSGPWTQAQMIAATGGSSFPQVVLNDVTIGGYQDLRTHLGV